MAKTKMKSTTQFNHAMIYVSDVARSLAFYKDQLGFRVLQTVEYNGHAVYARVRSPQGQTTIALHGPEGEWKPLPVGGIRLYFEVRDLDRVCKRLAKSGMKFKQMPKKMPWGWKHAYVDDPDGYEISLYWAGKARLVKS